MANEATPFPPGESVRVTGSEHLTSIMKETWTLLTTRLARVFLLTQSFLQLHEDLLIIQMGKLRHREKHWPKATQSTGFHPFHAGLGPAARAPPLY